MNKHPITEALEASETKAIKLVHGGGKQCRTAAYVDDQRVLVYGDAFYNEVLTLGEITHYRGCEPFPPVFDERLQPCEPPKKPGPLARKFMRATEEVNKLRTRHYRKPSLRTSQLLAEAVKRAEKLKRAVTYLAK